MYFFIRTTKLFFLGGGGVRSIGESSRVRYPCHSVLWFVSAVSPWAVLVWRACQSVCREFGEYSNWFKNIMLAKASPVRVRS